MWTWGLKRAMLEPEPLSIAWIARGVLTKRTSSRAAGELCTAPRLVTLQTPEASHVGSTRTRRPAVSASVTANDGASATPLPLRASSTADA